MSDLYVVCVWNDSDSPDIVGPFESEYEAHDFANRIELKAARDYGEEYGESDKMGAEVHRVNSPRSYSEEWFAFPLREDQNA